MPRHPAPSLPPIVPNPARTALALVVAIVLGAPPAARAQCTYVPLSPDVPVSTGAAVTDYSFSSPGAGWGAVGVRSAAGSEHSLGVFAQTASSPACVQNGVAASALTGGVDFVVGDFRLGRNAGGPWYGQVSRSAGSGSALVEWDRGDSTLVVDAPPRVRTTDHVLNVYNVFLEAGTSYAIVFEPAVGVNAKLLVFKNPGTGGYWASRSQALLETPVSVSYPAPASDEYAFVIVNDDGGSSSYTLAVDQCQPPIALTSNVAVATSPPMRYSLPQAAGYWSACGVRGGGGTDDWDLVAYLTGTGSSEPVCFRDTAAVSTRRSTGVDLVVGDFNRNPTAAYFARAVEFSGSQPGMVEWDGGPDSLTIGAPPIARTTGPNDVLEIWDVGLRAGNVYSIYFTKSGSADVKFLVFEDPSPRAGGSYWAARNDAVLTSAATADYTATADGYHGIAVLNDNGGTGGYQLAIYGAAAAVGDPPGPRASGIESIRPNPVLARASLTYRVSAPGRVAFDVLDVAGRKVARVAELDAAVGTGTVTLDARSAGHRLPAGIYFARMSVGGTPVAIRKFILLP